MNNLILFCVLVLVSKGVDSQKCGDCINYIDCPEALHLAKYVRTDETRQLFKEAHCESVSSGSSQPIVKVCCSMFSATNKEGGSIDTPEDIRIANHKNLKLLPEECGEIKTDRIVGGTEAELYEFPWMALIAHETRDGVEFKCGGSIINKRYILTAAHCVHKKKIFGVRLGEFDINTDTDCQKGVCESHTQDAQVEDRLVHPNYRGAPHVNNDIALLRLAQDIDFSHRNVQRICLPTTTKLRNRVLSKMNGTVAGWGRTEFGVDSDVLRKVDIPIHTAEQCAGAINRAGSRDATANKLCAGVLSKDSCTGDSGGPLMLTEEYNNKIRYVQYGVVSYGPQACGSESPGIYTDVTKYMGWILDNMSS